MKLNSGLRERSTAVETLERSKYLKMTGESQDGSGAFVDILDYDSGSESEGLHVGEEESEDIEESDSGIRQTAVGREGGKEPSMINHEAEEETEEEGASSSVVVISGKENKRKEGFESGTTKVKESMAIKRLLMSTPVDINKILQNQDAILSKRRMFLGGPRRKKQKGILSSIYKQSPEAMTMSERWKRYLSSLETDFFTSKEARMEEAGRVGKGKTAYSGLVLTAENNADIKHVYEIKFRTKQSLGQPTGSFDQFRTAAGQLSRLYFTLTRRDPMEFYERGRLLECITDINVCRALLGYFRIRGSHSTVASKSMHLRTLAHYAEVYFHGKDEELKGKAISSAEFLLSEAASEKTEARRFARAKKSTEKRLMAGTMLLPKDFIRSADVAKSQLGGIMSTFHKVKQERGLKKAIQVFEENGKILQKWSVNFLGLLVLTGGGQRPQVFCQLQLPGKSALTEMRKTTEKLGYFELRTLMEKTRRAFDLPNVIFPGNLLRFVDFHALSLRPILLKKSKRKEGALQEKTLLVDSRYGDPLSSQQVARTFQRFLCRVDPELEKVTPMALRGSYATMMLQAYREGNIFKEKSEKEFLEFLAKAMNTSVEQLAGTYAGNDMSDFEHCARELTSFLAFPETERVGNVYEETQPVNAASYLWS